MKLYENPDPMMRSVLISEEIRKQERRDSAQL